MRSHRRIRSMACLLLVALLLSGCQIGNTKVVFLKPVGYHQVFKIDKEVCRKKEAKVYLTNYMNIYGNAYGVSLRKQKSVQEDLEQYYQKCYDAYNNIFRRAGVPEVITVASDSVVNVAKNYLLMNISN